MIKPSVCPAVAEDAERIALLNETCLGKAYPLGRAQRQLKQLLLDPSQKVLVAVYHGQMIGYIHASDVLTTYQEPSKIIHSIVVDKEFRRQGVGRALLHAVELWAASDGCKTVTAAVAGNKAAQTFFVACGSEGKTSAKWFVKSTDQ
ncbi:MAG: GNAT family N-acetyltransferase [Clostridia bacterium]|nr:GNAT family N-acetyltransferase [Clostridia bacterium]